MFCGRLRRAGLALAAREHHVQILPLVRALLRGPLNVFGVAGRC